MAKRSEDGNFRAQQAQIITATVSVGVIQINAKQMTLSVFRQLQDKSIFDDDGNLLSEPWGWVNYDLNDHGASPFIFSYEGDLYRAFVNPEREKTLKVHAEFEPVHKPNSYGLDKTTWEPNGNWYLVDEDYTYRLDYSFTSEASAKSYLENRLEGIRVLELAPQLFIAV